MVGAEEWDLSNMRDRARAARLLASPEPEIILTTVAKEASAAVATGNGHWCWQDGEEMLGCGRAIFVLPLLTSGTYDFLFNGRSGYRAQYYLSCEEGEHFDALLVEVLLGSARSIFERDTKGHWWDDVCRSLRGAWSKIWVTGKNSEPFQDAREGELRPPRWVANVPHDTFGLRAPLPPVLDFDLKGTWISNADKSEQQDKEFKDDRSFRLHTRGFV